MDHLTRIKGVPNSEDVMPGMAFFAGTGPAGKTCGDCCFRGYYRKTMRGHEEHTSRTNACKAFSQLTGRHGPVVRREWSACKYYSPTEQS